MTALAVCLKDGYASSLRRNGKIVTIRLGSNVSALNAQRKLADGTAALSKTFERLSSGQRINRASDDAAGLAIADSLNATSRVFSQGIRNFNDGLSLINIADSAIEQLSSIVVRLQELAEQSANGVYSNTQRVALDTEAQSLSDEYTRIIDTSEFNGLNILNGETGEIRLQGGFGLNGSLAIHIGGSGPKLVGTGTFAAATSFSTGNYPNAVSTGDFNSDGVLDLVTADTFDGTASVLLGVGDGSFGAATSFAVGNASYSVSTGDFNGDGVLDLVTDDYSDNAVSVLLGVGDGSFGPAMQFSTGITADSVTTGDFNGDGVLDLVTADSFDVTASVLLGVGDGTFGAAAQFAVGDGPISVISGDFNGDGVLDLVTADLYGDTASVLLGVGDGSFAAATQFSVGNTPRSVTSGDFNGDGVLDLVTADSNDDTASVLLGVGDGTFGAATSFAVGNAPLSVSTGDFNGDGVLDLVTADAGNGSVSVLLGTGNGSFGAAAQFAVGGGPTSVTTGDFNGDGVLDLVTADTNGDTASVLLGQTTLSDGTASGIEPLDTFSLKSILDSRDALTAFKQTLSDLSTARGNLGGFQSRLAVAIATLEVGSENYRAAESRIRDADIAEESSRLVRLDILQQAASSVLAQANQQPALALQLLSG